MTHGGSVSVSYQTGCGNIYPYCVDVFDTAPSANSGDNAVSLTVTAPTTPGSYYKFSLAVALTNVHSTDKLVCTPNVPSAPSITINLANIATLNSFQSPVVISFEAAASTTSVTCEGTFDVVTLLNLAGFSIAQICAV